MTSGMPRCVFIWRSRTSCRHYPCKHYATNVYTAPGDSTGTPQEHPGIPGGSPGGLLEPLGKIRRGPSHGEARGYHNVPVACSRL